MLSRAKDELRKARWHTFIKVRERLGEGAGGGGPANFVVQWERGGL